jgi:antitoxin ParD1/3/4
MNVSIGERWTSFVEDIVKSGRYASASEVIREGLRLVEEREAKLQALRDTINASIEAGGHVSDEELGAFLDAQELAEQDEELVQEGH